jgi:carboxylate-amine ligase
MTFPFGSEFTVGIEEELFLVDATTHGLAPMTDDVLDAMRVDPQSAGHDAYAAQIELRSRASGSVAAAVESLAGLRGAATAAGGTLLGAGLHPDGGFGDATLVRGAPIRAGRRSASRSVAADA